MVATHLDKNLHYVSQLTGLVWAHLSNSFSFNSQGLHLWEVVVVSHHISDNGLLIRVVHTDICNPEKILFSALLTALPPRQQEQPRSVAQTSTGPCLPFGGLESSAIRVLIVRLTKEDETTSPPLLLYEHSKLPPITNKDIEILKDLILFLKNPRPLRWWNTCKTTMWKWIT